MHIMPNLGSDLGEAPGGRTETLMISCNSRYDYVMCGRQFLRNCLAEFNQIRYGTRILVVTDVHYARSRI